VTDVRTYQFVSPEWVDALRVIMEEAFESVDLDGIEFAFNEEYVNPPAELLGPGESTVGWYYRIRDGKVEVGGGSLPDATMTVRGDYETVRRLAKLSKSDPTEAAELERLAAEAHATGKLSFSGDPTAMPTAVTGLGLHDRVVPITA
jgi:hypothetical protein